MRDREHFGPSLRRERVERRISLQEIANATKVSIELWDGLERNDLSRWPAGIFARAFVRDYARVVGLNPDAVVDDFCRFFPQGDRRAGRIIEAQAELIGHKVGALEAASPLPTGRERRRARRAEIAAAPRHLTYAPRVAAAVLDVACVTILGTTAAALLRLPVGAMLGTTALIYFTAGTVVSGVSPGTRLVEILRHRNPALFTSRRPVSA